MTEAVSIPIAGFKDVYDLPTVEKALHELPASANEALRAIYEKMLRLGGQRFTVKPSALPEMQRLFEELPNFREVLEDIRKHLALCVDSNDSIELPPMLLLGEPGIGKTHFARKLAELLGTGFGFVPMSSLTAGWVLSGASSQWKNAKPGKVFDTILNGSYANPVIMVDELDKASAESQYDPLGALYSLLERETATTFVDEFVEIPMRLRDPNKVLDTEFKFAQLRDDIRGGAPLSEIRRVLRPGGRLALTTPAASRFRVLFRGIEHPYSPHVRAFTRRSLRSTLETMAFQVLELDSSHGTLLVLAVR